MSLHVGADAQAKTGRSMQTAAATLLTVLVVGALISTPAARGDDDDDYDYKIEESYRENYTAPPSPEDDSYYDYGPTEPYDPTYDLFMCPGIATAGAPYYPVPTDAMYTAKMEDHPNATTYEDVGLPTQYIQEGLHDALQAYSKEHPVHFISRHLLDYGSMFVATQPIADLPYAYLLTANSDLVGRTLSYLGIDFAPPFAGIRGLYTAKYDTVVTTFGIAVGVRVHRDDSLEYAVTDLAVAAFDMRMVQCEQNVRDCDGDVVCVGSADGDRFPRVVAGAYFKTLMPAPNVILMLPQAWGVQPGVIDIAHFYSETHRAKYAVGANLTAAPISAHIAHHSSDEVLTMRIGHGHDNMGLLGTLPNVAGMYGLFTANYTGPPGYTHVVGAARIRATVFGCATDCYNNATHRMENSPYFDATSGGTGDFGLCTRVSDYDLLPFDDAFIFDGNGSALGGFAAYEYGDITFNLLTLQFDPAIINAVLTNFSANRTAMFYSLFDIGPAQFGAYLNMRMAPYKTTNFGVTTGARFVDDDCPCTGAYCLSPLGYAIGFGDSRNNEVVHGKRVPGSSDLVVRQKFRILFYDSILAEEYGPYLGNEQIRGFDAPGNFMRIGTGYAGTSPLDVTAWAVTNATFEASLEYRIVARVLSCWDPFVDPPNCTSTTTSASASPSISPSASGESSPSPAPAAPAVRGSCGKCISRSRAWALWSW
jgi:hypothetical protein